MTPDVVATVAGLAVPVDELDTREARLRASRLATALPRPGTSEGRQLRRWLTQLMVTERVVAAEAEALGVTAEGAPAERELVPDNVARMELGSVAASVLHEPLTRAVFARVTAGVDVSDAEVADYHVRNPGRFATAEAVAGGWRRPVAHTTLDEVRPAITQHLSAAKRRRAFRFWLDSRCAELVELAPGYEHPGDPRQPDNTHRH